MLRCALSLALGGLGRDALRLGAGLGLALLVGLAFTISSVIVVLELALGAAIPTAIPSGPTPVPIAGGRQARVIALARAEIGTPYVWGGADPRSGLDCSGLVQWAYGQVGVSLPRTAQGQYVATRRLGPSDLRPADLVFFAQTYPSGDWITHVGIYLGDGQMVNAPAEGDVVRVMPVFGGYWGAHYAGAGRVAG